MDRIFVGSFPRPEKLPVLEDYNAVDDVTLALFMNVLIKNFRNVTEMGF